MSILYELLKKKWLIWALLCAPLLYFVVLPYFTGVYGVKYWGKATKNSGIIAVSLFTLSLACNPLRVVFDKVQLFKMTFRHRRNVGVAVFLYAVVHITCYIMKKGGFTQTLPYFLHPVIIPGLLAFCIFIPLTLSSNNYSVKKLGFHLWNRLHKAVYLAEGLVFIHMMLQPGKPQILALALFIPLFILQFLRRKKEKSVC